ncbi:trehalose-phosphatase [Sphingomonas mollis]|uniref:Trehalose 6-phosphate phosphatase n=1 Tax=Sphingomonas mollis TaxID=2795726 RepID=A0ABS0XSL6_9SPHN|nr:trehalose-phosphatase [Sphingomonas sp. BT553]MBJ6123022.1 trehalose-phosphatase [Sphingomonas sp. BT553]
MTEALLPPPLPDPATIALYLDFDGTLVDLADRPDAVVVESDLADLIDRLATAMPGRVAIVSGRSVAQLDGFLGDRATGLAVSGSHGAERRTPAAGHVLPERSPALEAAAAELQAFADLNGIIFEAKSLGAGLHFRQRPELEQEATTMAARVADTHGLTMQPGKMMAEVRLPGDKGAGLRSLATDDAMTGMLPWFFGDDVTDEDGFAAAAALGGAGVLIGPERETQAAYRLDDVAALRIWLNELADAA